ncbi:MAG: hypothetical protein SFU87_02655 [Chitinophagaceae bacterium]|nr:hypothetical protein [Chitinophagaceae bacterium]
MNMISAVLVKILLCALCYTAFPLHSYSLMNEEKNADSGIVIAKKVPGDGPYLRLNEIKLSAARHFKNKFPFVTDDCWLKIEKGYVAKFISNAVPYNVFYDNRGRFIYSASYYEAERMPQNIKKIFQKKYPGYSVKTVTEVNADEGTVYLVHIKTSEDFKIVQVVDEILSVLEDLDNGEADVIED